MLYGINTKERDRQGYLAEKNRYQPWSGAAMEGSVELLWQGRDITLAPGAQGQHPFGGFEAVYTGTGGAGARPHRGQLRRDPHWRVAGRYSSAPPSWARGARPSTAPPPWRPASPPWPPAGRRMCPTPR
ncbi:MAG: hypothetical protein ACLRWQ_04730 [Flavonifractor plautii]